MINILFFVLCLVNYGVSNSVDGVRNALKDDLKSEREEKFFNKSSLKRIHTKSGDIVDCIDIYKQPAFDHPLLKNHKLQRKPNFQGFNRKNSVNTSRSRPIFGLEKEQCPTGTVPIPRIKSNLIQAKALLNYHIKTQDLPGIHDAQLTLTAPYGPYCGVSAYNSIYNPRVGKDQMSISHLWVQNGPAESTNKIAAGWHVAPKIYGDYDTHVFAAWTSDNFKKTGCFNYQCKGFVQIDKTQYLGGTVSGISVKGGEMMEIGIEISQDPTTKNWWLKMENKSIGYFPAKLFSNMSSAYEVGWGGRTDTPPNTNSPEMGSGSFPDGSFGHASYFRQILFKNASNYVRTANEFQTQTFNDKPTCFGLEYYGDEKGEFGYTLEFGGPGGNCGI